jgi:cytochrome c-type biogenesis protein CcmH
VELYQQVFSPFCPGRSLNDCPSSKAQDLKLEMRKQLEGGMTPEQVLEGVFSKFGDQYRAVPRYDGFGKLVWWAPLGFIILGALLALSIARGRRSRAAQEVMAGARGSQSSKTAISDDVLTEIERELKDLDQ